MQEIMLAIVLGIAVGLANLLSYKIKFYLSKLSTLCLCTMLFCLGAKIGCDDALLLCLCTMLFCLGAKISCDDALLAKLGTLGVQAGAIAFGAVCGSILFLSAAIKLLARPADTEEGE